MKQKLLEVSQKQIGQLAELDMATPGSRSPMLFYVLLVGVCSTFLVTFSATKAQRNRLKLFIRQVKLFSLVLGKG